MIAVIISLIVSVYAGWWAQVQFMRRYGWRDNAQVHSLVVFLVTMYLVQVAVQFLLRLV